MSRHGASTLNASVRVPMIHRRGRHRLRRARRAMASPGPRARASVFRVDRDEGERPPPVSHLSVAALGALFLSQLALVILGIILCWYGQTGSDRSIRDALNMNGTALFENPSDSASVMGVVVMFLAAHGFFALWRRDKTHLLVYHAFALFVLVGLVFACAVMNIYKDSSGGMIENYYMKFQRNANITGLRKIGKPFAADHGMTRAQWFKELAEARTRARLYLRTVASCMGASMFFVLTSLACSAYIMGLKYTGTRVGYTTGTAGVIFGLMLFVLCYVVAKSTYNVPDAVSMKFDVGFTHDPGVYEPENAATLFRTLRTAPDLIFQTVDTDAGGGRRRLLTNSTSPPSLSPPPPSPLSPPPPSPSSPPPPPLSPPPLSDWRAQSVWVFEEGHIRVDSTHYNLTFKLALAGISGDDLTESFADWAAQKVADYGKVEKGNVYISDMISGAEHKIGGTWAPRFLAVISFIVVFVNFVGIHALYRDDRFLLAVHICFSFVGVILLIAFSAVVGTHADSTAQLIKNNWHSIQNKVVGAGVEPVEAGAFARAHMKMAAALGGTVIVLQLASMMASLFSFFSDEPSYSLLSPGTNRSNGAMSGRGFSAMELDNYDEEHGKRGSFFNKTHAQRGSDGLVNLSAPSQKHFSID